MLLKAVIAWEQWQRKRRTSQPMREDLVGGRIQGPGVQRIYRGVIFVTIGMFAGYASKQAVTRGAIARGPPARTHPLFAACSYASLNLLQHNLMVQMENNMKAAGTTMNDQDQKSFESQFKHAPSFVYIGNLVFRLAHNIVFACIVPRYRVYVSLLCMMTSMGMIGVGVYGFGGTSIGWVYGSYALGGIGIGTFESNLLRSITSLGHDTKLWAIAGMPSKSGSS